MDRQLILPKMKSPKPAGRIGSVRFLRFQDHYRICREAVRQQHQCGETADLIVVSAFVHGDFDEATYYADQLRTLGGERVRVVREGNETVSQFYAALNETMREGAELLIVCSVPQWPRIWWLKRKHKDVRISVVVVWGVPRPTELVTDLVLAVAFPLLDMFGKWEWLLKKLQQRREKGKL